MGNPNSKSDDSIEYIDDEKFERVWKVFTEFGITERHFNELESRYRNLASTWLLAVFAGFGFIITKEPIGVPFDRLLAITGIGIVGSIGIMLIWNLDLMVYHKLLTAVFEEGLDLEDNYPWLPQVRHNMMELHKGEGVEPRVVWFYLAGNSILLTISGGAFAFWLYKFSAIAVILEITMYSLIIFYLTRMMLKATGSTKTDIKKTR